MVNYFNFFAKQSRDKAHIAVSDANTINHLVIHRQVKTSYIDAIQKWRTRGTT